MSLNNKQKELRKFYESSLWEFARYINPGYMYGEIHEEAFKRVQASDEDESGEQDHFLLLLPRGHLKSHILAVTVLWKITKRPWSTFIYLTAGEDLATVQMSAIKGMMDTREYRLLWPEMIHPEESRRDKWSTWSINVDHPERKKRRIRDYTLIIKTLGSSSTGLHCSDLVLDDVVTPSNAYTEAGRKLVSTSVADFAAIKNVGAKTIAAGTRYDEKDVYADFEKAEVPIVDEETGEQTGTRKLWTIFSRSVEDQGDGMGNFLWPRVKSPVTGEWFGYDSSVLRMKKAEMDSMGQSAHFWAQYYNSPHAKGEEMVTEFQYYSRKNLTREGNKWYYMGRELAVFCGMDLAWTEGSENSRADYTAIVVIGVDSEGYIYLLDLNRFRTAKYSVYYSAIKQMHDLWKFRRIHLETESAGKLIFLEMQSRIREEGLNLSVTGQTASRKLNAKMESHAAWLEPRYANWSIYHFKGGLVPVLEDELRNYRSKFDDLKDALTIAIKNSKRPRATSFSVEKTMMASRTNRDNRIASRFGGRR